MTLIEVTTLLDQLDEQDINYSVSIAKGKKVGRVWIDSLRSTDERYHTVLAIVTRAFGRLDKAISNGGQSWSGQKDGTSLLMYRVASCKVTGYRTVERKKTVEVETDEVETEEVPIYDCTDTE